jgi:hypothetical protein
MFIGHFALAFAARRAAPTVPLSVGFAACQLADLVWPVFVLAGLEQVEVAPGITAVTPLDFVSYPWSHSLAALVGWAVVAALAWWLLRRRDTRGAIVVAALVLSHWLLDFVSHRPDLPLAPGDAARYGLGLWNSVELTFLVELAMFSAGLWLYVRTMKARSARANAILAGLVLLLLAIYFAAALGPPPPSGRAAAASALGLWLFVAWAHWADRRRVLRDHGHG